MILTMLLAVAWMPLTAHCQIENLSGLQVLRCSSMEAGAPAGDSHCDGDTCCAWESGKYRLPQSQPAVAAPLLAVVPMVAVLMVEHWTPAHTEGQSADESPPGLPKPWQFSLRAALPVRAPSIAS